MNGEFDRGRDGRRSVEDRGVDPLLDRALSITRELWDVLKAAERGVDDAARDLQRARAVHREAEAYERRGKELERKEEAIEREALGDLTGTTERRERGGRDGDGWDWWWGYGHDCFRRMDDGFRFMREPNHRADEYRRWGDDMRGHFREFGDHLRRWRPEWHGWDERYRPVFDDWCRRWDALGGRWDGHDWGRGDHRSWASHVGSMYTDFDGIRRHYGRMYDDWGRRGALQSPGTGMGGWR
jgi:hypothetical protein